MTDRTQRKEDSIREAIRERVRVMREELAHWEEMLRQCEKAARSAAEDDTQEGSRPANRANP